MRPAFVTGGSSGIGLAACCQLAQQGHDLAIFARSQDRLDEAKTKVLSIVPTCRIEVFAVDVSNADALGNTIATAVDLMGAPEIAIASAGIAEPGLFEKQSLSVHQNHMAINYFGSMGFAHALIEPMRTAGGGQIGFIASGAAFFGIYGYSAYAPSKFAIRGLAEVLRVELAPTGIGVTLCYPPDTDTPQLVAEKRSKPLATQKITEGGGLWSAENVAKAMLKGMKRNQFIVAPGLQMRALNRLTSLIAPALRHFQSRIIRKTHK